jgi:hypothetical protein
MTLREFLDRVKDVPDGAILCIAEVDEAFAANVAQVEVIDNARAERGDAADTEAVELGNGTDRVIVIRW